MDARTRQYCEGVFDAAYGAGTSLADLAGDGFVPVPWTTERYGRLLRQVEEFNRAAQDDLASGAAFGRRERRGMLVGPTSDLDFQQCTTFQVLVSESTLMYDVFWGRLRDVDASTPSGGALLDRYLRTKVEILPYLEEGWVRFLPHVSTWPGYDGRAIGKQVGLLAKRGIVAGDRQSLAVAEYVLTGRFGCTSSGSHFMTNSEAVTQANEAIPWEGPEQGDDGSGSGRGPGGGGPPGDGGAAQVAFDVFHDLGMEDALWTIQEAPPAELVRQRDSLADVRRALTRWFREAERLAPESDAATRVEHLRTAARRTLEPQLRRARVLRAQAAGRAAADRVIPVVVGAAVTRLPFLQDANVPLQTGAAGLAAAGLAWLLRSASRGRREVLHTNVAWSFRRLRQAVERPA